MKEKLSLRPKKLERERVDKGGWKSNEKKIHNQQIEKTVKNDQAMKKKIRKMTKRWENGKLSQTMRKTKQKNEQWSERKLHKKRRKIEK